MEKYYTRIAYELIETLKERDISYIQRGTSVFIVVNNPSFKDRCIMHLYREYDLIVDQSLIGDEIFSVLYIGSFRFLFDDKRRFISWDPETDSDW